MLALWVGSLITDGFAGNVWLGLFVDDEALGLLESVESFLLNAVYKIVACGNIVDEADDLTGSPDLWQWLVRLPLGECWDILGLLQ